MFQRKQFNFTLLDGWNGWIKKVANSSSFVRKAISKCKWFQDNITQGDVIPLNKLSHQLILLNFVLVSDCHLNFYDYYL